MSNYELPGPGPSRQGPYDSSFYRVRNGIPRLMTGWEEFMTRFRRGEYTEGFDSILSNSYLLSALCAKLQQYLTETPESDCSYVKMLLLLGELLRTRGEKEGEMYYLELSIQYLEQALNIIPEGHHWKADCLIGLATAFGLRSQHTWQIADADKALQYGQQAINATTDGRNPRQLLVRLGTSLRIRYRITHQIADLQNGIRYLQTALETPGIDRREHVDILNNLGNLYINLFERTTWETYLDLASEHAEKAVQISTDDDHKRATLLWNHALAFLSRSRMSRRVADIDMAIRYGQQNLDFVSRSDANYPAYLSGLGMIFRSRFHMTRQVSDLDEAIRHQEAVKHLRPNDQSPVGHHYNRGRSFVLNYQITRNGEDVTTAIRAFHEGFESEPSPFHRLLCGYNTCLIASLLPSVGLDLKVEIAEKMLEIFSLVSQPTGSRNDTQAILKRLSGMASLSASVLLAANKSPSEVLQKLEDNRGIVISSVIDVRSDAIELKEKHPALWARFTQCRHSLGVMNSNALRMEIGETYATDVERLEKFHKHWSDIKEDIRRNSGFERFLLSPTESELGGMARNSPIVSINISQIDSAAFLVTASGIQSLPLPALKFKDAENLVRIFASYGNSPRRDAELCEDEDEEQLSSQRTTSKIEDGLLYLWTTAVKPVLQQLNLLNRVDTPIRLPQIWWVGGGIMSLLPLHAAGDHGPGSTENAISHVISSYASTFKSLQFIQNRDRISVSQTKQVLLLAAMPTTPGGYKPLQVQEEVTAIEGSASKWASCLNLSRPSKADLLDALKTCTIAHFACHGTADRVEPAKSGLLLGKETVEKLTIEDLDILSCQNAQIVYLSACSTAEVGAMNLADESVHLASSFQLTGFQHVIGTLWGVDDNAAVEVAKGFYARLPVSGENGYISPARALHDAVVSFRNTGENRKDCSKWASFIHLGC